MIPAGGALYTKYALDDLEKEGAFPGLSVINFKKAGDALVPAEGDAEVTAAPTAARNLFAAGNKVFVGTANYLFELNGAEFTRYACPLPVRMLFVHDAEALERYYGLNASRGLLVLGPDGVMLRNATTGCTALAYHNGRLFAFNAGTVLFSEYGEIESFAVSGDPYKAGKIVFSKTCGAVQDVAERKECMYLFCDREIWRLDAGIDPLNFKLTQLPRPYGQILNGSVQDTGKEILFCTERGLFSFDGKRAEAVSHRLLSQVEFSGSMLTALWQGRYYARVRYTDGTRGMFVYDLASREAYRLDLYPNALAASSDLYFIAKNTFCVLAKTRGFAARGGGKGIVETGVFLPRGRDGFVLHAIEVDGAGPFTVTVTADGRTATVSAQGGERTLFPVPPRGGPISFRFETDAAEAIFRGFALEWQEVRRI